MDQGGSTLLDLSHGHTVLLMGVAPGLKTIEDTRQIRTRLLMAFEQAERFPIRTSAKP
jgi:NADH dehydrogenase FAD-containing subunit